MESILSFWNFYVVHGNTKLVRSLLCWQFKLSYFDDKIKDVLYRGKIKVSFSLIFQSLKNENQKSKHWDKRGNEFYIFNSHYNFMFSGIPQEEIQWFKTKTSKRPTKMGNL